MSVQFGRWNFDGKPVAPEYIERVNASLAPYGPDGKQMYWKEGVAILFHSFHTTKESRRETQPHVLPSGSVITWDGRLDNRKGLLSQLRDSLTAVPLPSHRITRPSSSKSNGYFSGTAAGHLMRNSTVALIGKVL